ncbi:MAG TPA: FxsA family protein [Candidatus Binatia bacterium]|nr:FxsA family protein [Candidatus Binatia bacterium]
MRLALLFIGLPLLELYILIKIGGYLGAFLTIALIIFTGIVGLLLARLEGLRTLRQIRQNLSQGIVPAEEMVDSVLIFVGGVLFVVPGVITDCAALVLLIPCTRTIFKRWLRRRFDRMVAKGNVRLQYHRSTPDDY